MGWSLKGFFRRATWSPADRMATLATLVVLLWLLLPSAVFLRPMALSIEGVTVTFTRATPLGSVRAYWFTEIRSAQGECAAPAAAQLTLYQSGSDAPWAVTDEGALKVRYALDPRLRPCAGPGTQFIVSHMHIVKLAGRVPLRPMETRWACTNDGSPCARLE